MGHVQRKLAKEFPDTTVGIRFCVYKLRQDPSLTIPDFRDEAAGYGIKLGGRALHSARKLLEIDTEPRKTTAIDNGSSLEQQLHEALTQVREEADEELARSRDSIRTVIGVLERTVED